jgi:hypothetical protein
VACGGALSILLSRLLRFFPHNTAPIFRRLVSPTAIVLRLIPRGSATERAVGAHTGDAPANLSAVTLLVFEAQADLHCNGPFGATYDSTDINKPQSSVSGRTFDTSGPRATDSMKCGVRGNTWRNSSRDGRTAAA